MDRTELMNLTYEAIDEIKSQAMYSNYLVAKKGIEKPELNPLIEAFIQAKQHFEKVAQYGKFHPDYKQATQVLMQTKTALYQTDEYRAYQQATETINIYLRDISFKMNEMLSTCLVASKEKAACHTKGH